MKYIFNYLTGLTIMIIGIIITIFAGPTYDWAEWEKLNYIGFGISTLGGILVVISFFYHSDADRG